MEVTKDQAVAFFESILGWVDLSEQNGRPKSEHARTHLEAILGMKSVPHCYQIQRVASGTAIADDGEKVEKLLDYVIAVATALKQSRQCSVCNVWVRATEVVHCDRCKLVFCPPCAHTKHHPSRE